MTQHRVIAEDSLSAMDQISKILGKDAVILETNKVNGKIEILGSNNIQDVASSNAKKIKKQRTSFSHLFSNHKLEEETQGRKLNSIISEKTEKKTVNNMNEANTNTDYVNHKTLSDFTIKIEKLLENMIISDINESELCNNQSSKIELLKKGFSKTIISEFKEKIVTEENIDPTLIFYHCLANKLVSPCEEKILDADIIFINGPSGSGKTTLCSKISSHILDNKFVSNERHKLSIANFAPISTNHSELLNFGRLLNLNVNNISNLEDLIAFVDVNKENRKLIIDVSQENKNTSGYIHYLEKLSLNKKILNILTLQASSNKSMIKSTMSFYKNTFPTIALTKLDESHICAEELSILGELNCKIGILSGSRSVIGSLAFAKKEVLAQYMNNLSL
jgi:flagellar biosynthesis protein FlhF